MDRIVGEVRQGMYLEDAISDLRGLEDFLREGPSLVSIPRERLIRAGAILIEELQQLSTELAEAEARAGDFGTSTVRGDHLILGEDAGGRRHFLAGRPVRAGTGLFLLTRHGWLSGRYEWSFRNGEPPRLHHRLPHGEEIEINLPREARLAWPADIDVDTV